MSLVLRMQLNEKAVTQYSNFTFNSSTQFNGKTLFANSTGIFSLEGTTDNGSPISTFIRFFATNFGIANLKRIRCLDIGIDTDGSHTVTVAGDESYTATKDLVPLNYDRQSTERIFIDRVVRGSFLTITIQNKNGSNFFISGIKAVVNILFGRTL